MSRLFPSLDQIRKLAAAAKAKPGVRLLLPVYRCLLSDQLTPVLAYRRLVRPDQRLAPSFLFESVIDGDRQGRYSFLGARPVAELLAYDQDVTYCDHLDPGRNSQRYAEDPLRIMADLSRQWELLPGVEDLPAFTGGWVGYVGYDTVRYLEREKLTGAPPDDRRLPDLHMQLYREVIAFDHVRKTVLVITHVEVTADFDAQAACAEAEARLDELVRMIETPYRDPQTGMELAPGDIDLHSPPPQLPVSNMGAGGYQNAVRQAKEYIMAGDIFQVVPSQRFELTTTADPFDIYRALRVVNPSPYMFYLQAQGSMLIGSSPEILCRVQDGVVTNRPLAGTRRRGQDEAEDRALEAELLADPKERAEHIMLVDLGRNDVGRVATPGTIALPRVMNVERYSHVMHISSTVTGRLREGSDRWEALQMALPVGTVSGAPKVRAMQVIDELEPTRRGPYAGAVGYADFAGHMDMAIALRTMVVLPADAGKSPGGRWKVHLQAGAGIVADSDPDSEHQETVNKAAALAKAVDLAQRAFGTGVKPA